MKKHPFKPFIKKNSKSIIIGTLPPENIDYYYSNSPNTRMWDLLKAIKDNTTEIPKNSYLLSKKEKKKILDELNLSMTDIILEYERKSETTKDKDIIPIKYNDVLDLIKYTDINNLLFVYKNAYKYFKHSLLNKVPVQIHKINIKVDNKTYGLQEVLNINGKQVHCILLPSPLNRGEEGWSLKKKLEIYKKYI